MIKTALAAASLLPVAAHAQDLPPVHYPAIAAHAANGAGFTPAGWTLEQSQTGDLNGDGRPDLALAFHQNDARNVIKNEGGFCGDTLDTNPRILAIAFAASGGGYDLAAQNHSLIPRRDNACADDWFGGDADGGITIERGTLHVALGRFRSAGGWSMGTTTFTLRWQQGALRLIGFDYSNVQRNTGETATLSVNYLTRRVKISRGTIDSDKEKVTASSIRAGAPPTIDQVGDGMEFDAGGLVSNL